MQKIKPALLAGFVRMLQYKNKTIYPKNTITKTISVTRLIKM